MKWKEKPVTKLIKSGIFNMHTVIILTVLLIGCQKSDQVKPKSAKVEAENVAQTHFSINNNASNPNDHLGHHLNYALDEIGGRIDFPDSLFASEAHTEAELYLNDSLTGNHFLSYNDAKNHSQDFLEDTSANKQECANISQSYYFNYFDDHTSLSSTADNYLDDMEAYYDTAQTVSHLIDDLVSLESQVINDTTLTTKEFEMLTGLLAIARNSLDYWDNVKNTSSHAWHDAYTQNITINEQTELVYNLSLGNSCTYGLIFLDEYNNGFNIHNSHSAAVQQAVFHDVGPLTVAVGDW